MIMAGSGVLTIYNRYFFVRRLAYSVETGEDLTAGR